MYIELIQNIPQSPLFTVCCSQAHTLLVQARRRRSRAPDIRSSKKRLVTSRYLPANIFELLLTFVSSLRTLGLTAPVISTQRGTSAHNNTRLHLSCASFVEPRIDCPELRLRQGMCKRLEQNYLTPPSTNHCSPQLPGPHCDSRRADTTSTLARAGQSSKKCLVTSYLPEKHF
jgi:hypothetical protein